MQRDVQGKFALKNDEHRSVRSLRLTDTTWSALGGIAESLGITRADYLEQIIHENALIVQFLQVIHGKEIPLLHVIHGKLWLLYRVIHGLKKK